MKVFLGGTYANSTWRDTLIPMLGNNKIDYFNPVVEDWNEKAQEEEERQKWEECDIHLYYITPNMKGFFSLIELMETEEGRYNLYRLLKLYVDKKAKGGKINIDNQEYEITIG